MKIAKVVVGEILIIGFIDLAVTNDGYNKLYQNINGSSFKSIIVDLLIL